VGRVAGTPVLGRHQTLVPRQREEGEAQVFAFIANRLLSAVPVLATVAIVVFLMLRLTPGDPAAVIAGDTATAEQVAEIRSKLGLDRPMVEQFVIWAGRGLRGDLGESFFFKKPVAELVVQRIEPTLSLAAATIVLAVLVAVPLGVLAANRHGSVLDRCLMGFSVLGFSVPVFVIGYLLIYIFAIKLNWLPVQGYRRIGENVWDWALHLILPSITLAVIYVALIARMTRASVIEVLAEDYIRTARAKGLTNRVILIRHALKNAAIPIVTVIGLGVALLIGGVVVTESVYNIPGLGRLTVDAVLARDYPVIQAIILLFSFAYVLINLLIDLAYSLFDPRIRY
jgi:peptide/nickel transport system permease protein